MNTQKQNPYIGPRTFQKEEGDRFYGRDREARDLSALVASEKLVLLYAQSGAGKSSLINTRLIPDLEQKLYEVLPVARVSGEAAGDIQVENIYVYNLLRSLLRRETDPQLLASLTLSQFLDRLNEDEGGYFYDESLPAPLRSNPEIIPWPRALIIDQFEEIFSTHQESWKKRGDFFMQLAEAMQSDPYLSIILVMREDFIANLDPYFHLIPGGLRVRYFMQRLSRESAQDAIRKPAEKAGRPFAPGVAEKLVDDLSSIKVQKADGSAGTTPGQFVEAVQLQVICYNLWEHLSEGTQITEQDLVAVGNVDDALGKYYADRVAGVARQHGVSERALRDWIEKKLIAAGGVRNMVLQEVGKTTEEGISDRVIQALQSDLVRAENRGGAIWYELTHDRLVAPILENNKNWFEANLSPLQRQAVLWSDQNKNESWLLRDQALAEMEAWAAEHPGEMTRLETEYLQACHKQQEQIKMKEEARSASRLRVFLGVAGSLALIALLAAGIAFWQYRLADGAKVEAQRQQGVAEQQRNIAEAAKAAAETSELEAVKQREIAEEQRKLAQIAADQALAGNLAAQANSLRNTDYPLALLLGVEAFKRNPDSILTRQILFDLLQFTPYKRNYDFKSSITSVGASPDGSLIATSSCADQKCTNGEIGLFDAEMNPLVNLSTIFKDFGTVYSLAFNQDGTLLAAGGCVTGSASSNEPGQSRGCVDKKGQITLWDVSDPDHPVLVKNIVTDARDQNIKHNGRVKSVAFSPDGSRLASGSYDQTIILWDTSDPANTTPLQRFRGHYSFVNDLAFVDQNNLVSVGDDKNIFLWNLAKPEETPKVYKNHEAPINTVAFNPEKNILATAGDDNVVILWDWNPAGSTLKEEARLEGHTGFIKDLSFNTAGTLLASAGFDNSVILWRLDPENGRPVEQIGVPLSAHNGAINGVALGSEGDSPYLVSGSDDRTAIRWNISVREPLSVVFPQEVQAELLQEASSSKYDARVIGQQVELALKDVTGSNTFLTLDQLNPDTRLGFDNDKLLTRDQTRNNWVTEWLIDPESAGWISLACEAAKRNLTEEEWKNYLPNVDYQKTCEEDMG